MPATCTRAHPADRLRVWEAVDVRLIDGAWREVAVWCLGCCACGAAWTTETLLNGITPSLAKEVA